MRQSRNDAYMLQQHFYNSNPPPPSDINHPNHKIRQRYYFENEKEAGKAIGRNQWRKEKLEEDFNVEIEVKQDRVKNKTFFDIKSFFNEGRDVDQVIKSLNKVLNKNTSSPQAPQPPSMYGAPQIVNNHFSYFPPTQNNSINHSKGFNQRQKFEK